jgi:predicted enzyme related to lactoylglutathione lyase
MSKLPKVGWFEIQVDDFIRAQHFYHEVFGWNFSKVDAPFDYYMIDSGGKEEERINGAMSKRQIPLAKHNGVSGYVCAIYVDSIDKTFEKVKKHGGEVTLEKMEQPGMGYFAYGIDSEGNSFGLWENK